MSYSKQEEYDAEDLMSLIVDELEEIDYDIYSVTEGGPLSRIASICGFAMRDGKLVPVEWED